MSKITRVTPTAGSSGGGKAQCRAVPCGSTPPPATMVYDVLEVRMKYAFGLLLLLSVGCANLNRQMYGYDRIINLDASEPDVQVYARFSKTYDANQHVSLRLLGKTPLQVPALGGGFVEVWAVKGDKLLRTAVSWESAEKQVINFQPAVAMSRDERCCIVGKVYVGMPDSAARISWGDPATINRTTTAFGVNEQWCYSHIDSYLYIENGRVTAIQN